MGGFLVLGRGDGGPMGDPCGANLRLCYSAGGGWGAGWGALGFSAGGSSHSQNGMREYFRVNSESNRIDCRAA
jgi:hypothetical protein